MNIEEKLDNKPCNGCGAMTEHGCPEMKDCLEYHNWNNGINAKSDRDIIVALFHRIGEQLELKEEWAKLPNAERSAMAGDFYNIIKMHTSAEVLDVLYPPNTKINSDGYLDGGWEIDPKALKRISTTISKTPSFGIDVELEEIETVILAVRAEMIKLMEELK